LCIGCKIWIIKKWKSKKYIFDLPSSYPSLFCLLSFNMIFPCSTERLAHFWWTCVITRLNTLTFQAFSTMEKLFENVYDSWKASFDFKTENKVLAKITQYKIVVLLSKCNPFCHRKCVINIGGYFWKNRLNGYQL